MRAPRTDAGDPEQIIFKLLGLPGAIESKLPVKNGPRYGDKRARAGCRDAERRDIRAGKLRGPGENSSDRAPDVKRPAVTLGKTPRNRYCPCDADLLPQHGPHDRFKGIPGQRKSHSRSILDERAKTLVPFQMRGNCQGISIEIEHPSNAPHRLSKERRPDSFKRDSDGVFAAGFRPYLDDARSPADGNRSPVCLTIDFFHAADSAFPEESKQLIPAEWRVIGKGKGE